MLLRAEFAETNGSWICVYNRMIQRLGRKRERESERKQVIRKLLLLLLAAASVCCWSIVFPVGISGLISRGQRSRARPFSPVSVPGRWFLSRRASPPRQSSCFSNGPWRRSASPSLMFHRRSSVVLLYLYSRFVVLFPGFLHLLVAIVFFFLLFAFSTHLSPRFAFLLLLLLPLLLLGNDGLLVRCERAFLSRATRSPDDYGDVCRRGSGLLYGWLPPPETYIARTFRSCRDRTSAGHRGGMRVARVSYLSVTAQLVQMRFFHPSPPRNWSWSSFNKQDSFLYDDQQPINVRSRTSEFKEKLFIDSRRSKMSSLTF